MLAFDASYVRLRTVLIGLVALAVLLGQSMAAGHAHEHEEEPEHQICSVCVLAGRLDGDESGDGFDINSEPDVTVPVSPATYDAVWAGATYDHALPTARSLRGYRAVGARAPPYTA